MCNWSLIISYIFLFKTILVSIQWVVSDKIWVISEQSNKIWFYFRLYQWLSFMVPKACPPPSLPPSLFPLFSFPFLSSLSFLSFSSFPSFTFFLLFYIFTCLKFICILKLMIGHILKSNILLRKYKMMIHLIKDILGSINMINRYLRICWI